MSKTRRTDQPNACLPRAAQAILFTLFTLVAWTSLGHGALGTHAVAQSTEPQILPKTYEGIYQVSYRAMTVGRAEVRLERDGSRWQMTTKARPTGLARVFVGARAEMRSQGEIWHHGLRPVSYDAVTTGDDASTTAIRFDWARGHARAERDGKVVESSLNGPCYDPLSLQLEAGRRLREGFESIQLCMLEKSTPKLYVVSYEGYETLELPAGDIRALKLRQERAGGSKRTTYAWYAPSLDYVAVRIEHHKRDRIQSALELAEFRWLGAP